MDAKTLTLTLLRVYIIIVGKTDMKLWKDMTPEEKGALLLAYHEGKVIEYRWFDEKTWVEAHKRDTSKLSWQKDIYYRVKPEPKQPREFWLVNTHAFFTEGGANCFRDSLPKKGPNKGVEVIHVREVLE